MYTLSLKILLSSNEFRSWKRYHFKTGVVVFVWHRLSAGLSFVSKSSKLTTSCLWNLSFTPSLQTYQFKCVFFKVWNYCFLFVCLFVFVVVRVFLFVFLLFCFVVLLLFFFAGGVIEKTWTYPTHLFSLASFTNSNLLELKNAWNYYKSLSAKVMPIGSIDCTQT